MAAKSGKLGTWIKMMAAGGVMCIGGPALVWWVSPTDEELFKKYNPELQKKSLARRYERQKEFDDFMTQVKADSKSSKPIWTVQEDALRKRKEDKLRQDFLDAEEAKARKESLRKESGLSSSS
ncbi:CBP4-domain-containing protein [Hypoxylon fragiforme]|uniref:CBP4-domain-containing protein n=1 Tax=Hypoxylon fragiforme TaxID=63214 RepID=UPI0020C6261E|nr:CBP4-domain-containing protein [Hypoxylon fragiforme]KAI2604788.1 CBP4-domain-containing protein [Hypoxylon fragiforme]